MAISDATLSQTYGKFIHANALREALYDWYGTNTALLRAIYSIHGPTYDSVMLALSHLADRHNFLYYLGGAFIFMLLSLLVRSIRKTCGGRHFFHMWIGIFMLLVVGYAVNSETIGLCKGYFSFPRPYVALEGIEGLDIDPNKSDDEYRSFPSGHVAFATMVVMALWPALSKNLRLTGCGFIAAVAWSRMALGMHFPADVLGAFLITLIVMSVLRTFLYAFLRRFCGVNC